MPSQAGQSFSENRKDIERLVKIHSDVAGDEAGRKWGVEVLNKSAIVLICATWEAYVEDLVQEGVEHICLYCPNPTQLPVNLQREIADEIKRQSNTNPVSPWKLAANGWQTELRNNLSRLKGLYVQNWNTPKWGNVDLLIEKALGLPQVSSYWKRKALTIAKARKKLDDYVVLRGGIAHRLMPGKTVYKYDATGFLKHVTRLVEFTDNAINRHLHSITGRPLF